MLADDGITTLQADNKSEFFPYPVYRPDFASPKTRSEAQLSVFINATSVFIIPSGAVSESEIVRAPCPSR